jgi:transcriptional regulator with XRE-family HTH domain
MENKIMNVPIKNNFAVLLQKKQDKEHRFIPLSEVAQATGITRKTLYQWEKNVITRYDPKVIDALCEYFGVTLSELLDHTLPAEDETPPAQKKK